MGVFVEETQLVVNAMVNRRNLYKVVTSNNGPTSGDRRKKRASMMVFGTFASDGQVGTPFTLHPWSVGPH